MRRLGDVATGAGGPTNLGAICSSRNSAMRTVLVRLGLTVAALAIAVPAYAQVPIAGRTSPYDAAVARLKKAHDQGILAGQKSPTGAFPFMVALIQSEAVDNEEGNFSGQYCGGALVGPLGRHRCTMRGGRE